VGPRASLDNVEKRKFLTLPGLELGPLDCPARSQSLYRLRYSSSIMFGTEYKLRTSSLCNILLLPHISSPLRSNTAFSTVLSHKLTPCFSLSMRDRMHYLRYIQLRSVMFLALVLPLFLHDCHYTNRFAYPISAALIGIETRNCLDN
jgi:hypothetical protein